MSDLTSFRAIIELWKTREELAAELDAAAAPGLPALGASGVSKWWQRDRIPAEWWTTLLPLSKSREAGVTADLLAELAARRDRVAEVA